MNNMNEIRKENLVRSKVLTASRAVVELKTHQEPKRIPVLSSFFKTGKGQYGEGDKFIGVTVPNIRIVAKKFIDMKLVEIEKLLMSKVHEHRSLALYILDARCRSMEKQSNSDTSAKHKQIFDFYLAHSNRINNWDLVDVSAPHVVGSYLFHNKKIPEATRILGKLARSENLWERRIAIIATFYYISRGEFAPSLAIAEMLLNDKHDLIHKAVGWMLREMGKRDTKSLHTFLKAHARVMPRKALRYAIERLGDADKARYMAM